VVAETGQTRTNSNGLQHLYNKLHKKIVSYTADMATVKLKVNADLYSALS